MHTCKSHTHPNTCSHVGGCVFSSEKNLTTMISIQMAADIINSVFHTEFRMFKVNKSELSVMVAITPHPVETFKK